MNAVCFTNRDSHKAEKWPTEFWAMPVRGDRVRAVSGKELTVVGIVHALDDKGKPYVEIELH